MSVCKEKGEGYNFDECVWKRGRGITRRACVRKRGGASPDECLCGEGEGHHLTRVLGEEKRYHLTSVSKEKGKEHHLTSECVRRIGGVSLDMCVRRIGRNIT
jgi:hypothetical protein